MYNAVFLIAVLVTTACSKKDGNTAAPAADDPAAAAPAGSAAPAAPAAPAAGGLNCDKVLANNLRDKYFAGTTITDVAQPVAFSGKCEIKLAEGDPLETASVEVSCHDNVKLAKDDSIAGIKKAMKGAKDLPGVGDGAVVYDLTVGTQVSAWDNDSNCQVLVMLPKAVDATAFTNDLLASLPPT